MADQELCGDDVNWVNDDADVFDCWMACNEAWSCELLVHRLEWWCCYFALVKDMALTLQWVICSCLPALQHNKEALQGSGLGGG